MLTIVTALVLLIPVFADEQKQLKEKITITEDKYSNSKKQQGREYKKRQWKEQHVNKWINSDKDYLKLSIEYKKRYLDWAKKQKEQGKDTDVERFIKDEKLDPVEQEIVHALQTKEKDEKNKANDVNSKKHVIVPAGNQKVSAIKNKRKSTLNSTEKKEEIHQTADSPGVITHNDIIAEKGSFSAEDPPTEASISELTGTQTNEKKTSVNLIIPVVITIILLLMVILLFARRRLSRLKVIR